MINVYFYILRSETYEEKYYGLRIVRIGLFLFFFHCKTVQNWKIQYIVQTNVFVAHAYSTLQCRKHREREYNCTNIYTFYRVVFHRQFHLHLLTGNFTERLTGIRNRFSISWNRFSADCISSVNSKCHFLHASFHDYSLCFSLSLSFFLRR